MTKLKSKTKTAGQPSTRKPRKPKHRAPSGRASPNIKTRYLTKHARVITMLRSPPGATIAAIMSITDWQQHSVRGFLAGVVRKKLGLNLVSEQSDEGRLYRIKDGKGSAADRAKQAA